jgi:hypothetical protein
MKLDENKLRKIIRKEMLSYEQQQLNEGIMDFFGSVLGSGANAVIDRAKGAAAGWLLQRLGVNTDGLLGRTLVNVFENLEMSELWSIVSGDQARCPLIAREILEAFAETLLEQIPEVLGISTDGWFSGVIREMITNSIVRDNQLIARISQAICSLDVSQVFQSAGANPQAAERLEQSVAGGAGALAGAGRQVAGARGGATAPGSQARQLREARERYQRIIMEERKTRRR